MMRCLILLGACCVAYGDEGTPPVRAVSGGRDQSTSPGSGLPGSASPSAEVRDCLLMLDDGPLHLRFHISLGGQSLSAAREAYVDRLMFKLDIDGDGKLTSDEAARSPLLTRRRRPGATAFLDATKRIVQRQEITQQVERVGKGTVIYRQDASAAGNDREVFKFLDVDASGFIDRPEMSAAASRILERDSDEDECISFQEFLPPPPADAQAQAPLAGPTRPDRAVATIADLLRDVSERTLPERLLAKYDRDKDKGLTAAELGWKADRLEAIDANGDGRLHAAELRRLAATPVDLELALDLMGPARERWPALTVVSAAGQRADDARRPDLVRLAFPSTVLTISFRKRDPIKLAIDNAMRAFNRIDVDGNGYLDPMETSQLVRFKEEGLFDALDADGDGKIFGEEVEKYVTVRGEPASTAAWVNIYDTGRGFFEALDRNGDGRLSMREMQTSEKALLTMKRHAGDRLAPGDPVRNFHIEFMRGSFQLFGPAERLIAQTQAFEERTAIGPVWFQRMDRNNDGDLTWNEFLGPRDVFHRIDKDGDGLIDPQEAEQVNDE